MTDSINVNLNNLSDKERDKLLALVEKANGKGEFPANNEIYYSINSSGSINSDKFFSCLVDRERKNIGNCFRTSEEAKFEAERLKVLHRMRKIAGDTVLRKEYLCDSKEHCALIDYCTLVYDDNDKIRPSTVIKTYYNDDIPAYGVELVASEVLFPNRSSAVRAIVEIGVDTLKKYYFRIAE